MARARLLISCADRPGIVSAASTFLYRCGANILSSDQHSTNPRGGRFFMRMEFDTDGMKVPLTELERGFAADVAAPLGMEWRIGRAEELKRVAILVSREDHCLLDLLWRWRRGELEADVRLVVSNHEQLRSAVEAFDLPFVHVPVERNRRDRAEGELLRLFKGEVDLVVLARYMQVLSGGFLKRLGAPVINIHHSFLPAFVGADPYGRAHARGVKIIGATAHYATEELDSGPIIEQDIERVSHRHGVGDLEHVGRDIERTVLARAVRWHLEDRLLVDGNKTVVF